MGRLRDIVARRAALEAERERELERRAVADAAFARLMADVRRDELEAIEDNRVYLDTYVLLPEPPEPKATARRARSWAA
jgi:hypothetical protein